MWPPVPLLTKPSAKHWNNPASNRATQCTVCLKETFRRFYLWLEKIHLSEKILPKDPHLLPHESPFTLPDPGKWTCQSCNVLCVLNSHGNQDPDFLRYLSGIAALSISFHFQEVFRKSGAKNPTMGFSLLNQRATNSHHLHLKAADRETP